MEVYNLVLGFLVIGIYLVATAIGLADYIISSLAMFRIARKRGVSIPWLAWIPIAKEWTFGSIVDDFESEKGSKRKFRVILLALSLVVLALTALMIIVMVAYIVYVAMVTYGSIIPTVGEEIALVISLYIAILPLAFVSTAYGVLYIICLHKLHENIYPEKSIKYAVVSFLVPLGLSICLLKNSKRCEEKVFFQTTAPVNEFTPEIVPEETKEESLEKEEAEGE
ncbi:MAG: hypothetical protein IKB35_01765 [Clostridia bacterium]|nr:hypothetical protein [Clostridia bacterium]